MSELSNHIVKDCYSQNYSEESTSEILENIARSLFVIFSNLFTDLRFREES